MRAFASLEGSRMCTCTMGVSVQSLHKDSTDYLIHKNECTQTSFPIFQYSPPT